MSNSPRGPSFFDELKRRRVVRVGVAYGAAVFVVLQAADLILAALEFPDSVFRALTIVCLAGFPVALALGWVFDLTPEGVRLTAGRGEAGRLLARVRPWVIFAPVLALLLSAVAFAVVVNAPRAAGGAVRPGAEVIAVMPFSITGGGVDLTGEGFVDLLSRNLDQVGGIRTVDPRTVLYRWDRNGTTAERAPQATAIEIGQEVRAGSVLTGSAVLAGREVRISADLYPVDGGDALASVQVQGPSDHLLELVDSLSVSLLRSLWSSRQPMPRIDVKAITSGDIDAIRAYLRGEQFYRASAWDSALVWFARAVAEDSMFPLAHYRLAMTSGWGSEGAAAAAGKASTTLALAYADRLPPREQVLVRIMGLRSEIGVPAAMDTLRAYLSTYPDDAEAWFLLADDEYHTKDESSAPSGRRAEEMLVLFDRVLGLDPSFIPALIHPLEIAFRTGDPRLIDQYTSLLAAVAPGNAGAELYRDAAAALQSLDPDALGRALARSVAAGDSASADLSRQASLAVHRPLIGAIVQLSPDARDVALGALRDNLGGTHRDAAAMTVAHVQLALGDVAAARAALAPLARDPLLDDGRVRSLDRLPIYAGVADSSAIADLLIPPEAAGVEILRLIAAVDVRDAAAARGAANALTTLAADSAWRIVAEAADAFAIALAGDTIAGLARLQATLPNTGVQAGSLFDALWFRWVALLAEHPQTRAKAIEMLRRPWPGDPALDLQRLYILARAHEAGGDAANARIAYTRFITAVGEPDSLAGPLQARARTARDALARMGSRASNGV